MRTLLGTRAVLALMALVAAGRAVAAGEEVPISTPGPQGALAGTLARPTDALKAVALIIPGSGPTDRDGNNPMGIKAAPYRVLAHDLAARGIATVRIDKRGMFGSAGATIDPNAVTIADYVADTRAWVAAARRATGARCIWLMGHSEGGLVALAAAQTPDVCGLVLLAAAGRPVATVLREQLQANPANAPVLDQAMSAIGELERGKRVDTRAMHPALLPLFNDGVQNYLIDLFRYDPAKLIATYRGPVLIVQGDHDLQVSLTDAHALASADPRARLLLVPDMNHVLKRAVSDDRAANFATYANPALPLAPGLVDGIAQFLIQPATH